MLATLGFAMIATFIALLMTRRLSALAALVLVPIVFAFIGGFGSAVGDMIVNGIRMVAPTGVLMIFAMLYFMVMTDAGMFDPLAKAIVKMVGGDPVKIFAGSVALAFLVALDGDGATVYMIVLSAMLPLYDRLGLSRPLVACLLLQCTGLGNMVPWGGPTARAALSMQSEMSDVFTPLVVPMLACVVWTFVMAYLFGRRERKRIGIAQLPPDAAVDSVTGPGRVRFVFNWALTIALMTALLTELFPTPVLFMIASAIALRVNFPKLEEQSERLATHAPAILAVASLSFAAGVFTGVLSGTKMAPAMAEAVANVVPSRLAPFMAVITALISIPMTWTVSNDVFYFGILPVLSGVAGQYGITPAEMARAGLIGQPVHIMSPLVASTYLLVGMLSLDYGRTQRQVVPWSAVTSLIMLCAAIATGAVPLYRNVISDPAQTHVVHPSQD
jgi:CitMHS family citrate-Mg2+:H+ or citrate-Ca2+:H+ symporter